MLEIADIHLQTEFVLNWHTGYAVDLWFLCEQVVRTGISKPDTGSSEFLDLVRSAGVKVEVDILCTPSSSNVVIYESTAGCAATAAVCADMDTWKGSSCVKQKSTSGRQLSNQKRKEKSDLLISNVKDSFLTTVETIFGRTRFSKDASATIRDFLQVLIWLQENCALFIE
jgi:hypothetical protein